MSIWRGKSAVPSVGPDIHIKYKFLGGLDDQYMDTATEAIGLARLMMRQVTSVMSGGVFALSVDQLQYFDYYFVCGGNPPSNSDFIIVQQTLLAINNGLFSQGLGIKVTNQGDSMGYVNLHTGKKTKKDWVAGRSMRTGNLVQRGNIHVDSNRLDTGPELSAKTVIHEASHRFASTGDFGEKGYTYDDSGLFRDVGLTHAEALNNAESYARFVMMSFLFPNG